MVRYSATLVLSIALLFGCEEQRQSISHYPMLSDGVGNGPWQIVTYDGDKVYHETITLDGRAVSVRTETVYISNESQFIYRDGTPITTYDGKYLYWNTDGMVINRLIEPIPEDQVFVVNTKPMRVGTAMRLRDYHKVATGPTLAGIGKAE